MAWPGTGIGKILAFTVTNSLNSGASAMTASTDAFWIALYGNGTPVNTGTTLVGTEYGATWNTCTEVANSGTYAAGGALISGSTQAQSTNTWTMACSTPNSWTGATIASYGALVYDHTVGAKPGLCYLDFAGLQSVTTGTFTVTYAPAIATINFT